MAGPLAAPIVGAVGSLLGGLLGKSKTTTTYTDTLNETARAIKGQAIGAREAARNQQFNPLTLLGVSAPVAGQAVTTSTENFMGSAVADAAMLIADGMAKAREEKSNLAIAEKENEELRKKVNDLTLRPKVGGIYASTERTPSVREALGVKPAGPRPLVNVRDAASGKWLKLDSGVADRLKLGDGDTLIAEDYEAMQGDVVSEATNIGNIVIGAGSGNDGPVYSGSGLRKARRKPEYIFAPGHSFDFGF